MGDAHLILRDRHLASQNRGELGLETVDIPQELGGRSLVCWCDTDRPCHADVLLETASEAAAKGARMCGRCPASESDLDFFCERCEHCDRHCNCED